MPTDASVSHFNDQMLLSLRSDWHLPGGRTLAAGGLYAAPLEAFLVPAAEEFAPLQSTSPPSGVEIHELFAPSAEVSLQGWTQTKNYLILTVLDKVKSGVRGWRLAGAAWAAVADSGDAAPISLSVIMLL